MYVTREEVKVYHPEEGKAIKLSKNGKLISYMVVPYFALPQYDFEVEEVDISEAENYYDKANNKLRRMVKFLNGSR